jgi:hypothetical protein
MAANYFPQAEFDFRFPGEDIDAAAQTYEYQYRVDMAAVATRTARVAFAFCMMGYYHQSLSLYRSMYETFRRMMFVRRRPTIVFRLYPVDMIADDVKLMQGYKRKSESILADDWQRFIRELEDEGTETETDRRLLEKSRLQNIDLHQHAHADIEGTSDLMIVESGLLNPRKSELLPKASTIHLEGNLVVGCNGVSMILYEISMWNQDNQEWMAQHSEWINEYVSISQNHRQVYDAP